MSIEQRKESNKTSDEYESDLRQISQNEKRQDDDNYVGEDRRPQPLWEQIEFTLNKLCREVSIANRKGKVSVALDDDKIWLEQTGENAKDKAGLNFTTHMRDNRKGLIAHTAVSTGVNLLLGTWVYNLILMKRTYEISQLFLNLNVVDY